MDLLSLENLQWSDKTNAKREVLEGREDNKKKGVQGVENSKNTRLVNKDIKKVAEEMESLFAYQLLKIMRKTAESMSTEKKENGQNTYLSLFDMEVSKLLAKRGMGLQDSIINWLDRLPSAYIDNGDMLSPSDESKHPKVLNENADKTNRSVK